MNTSRRIVVDRLVLEHRVVHPGQLGDVEAADGLLLRLVLRILRNGFRGERLEVDAVVLVARVGEAAVLELVVEIGDAFIAVAAVRGSRCG
jgi:hypothetical protein